ncbi:DUF3319 domain-containing protein [Enterovibrio nigricans]|uniref:DUF3319 domain-containing protein n=1 Tax=Enterovibrio nigricans DSM 22720 TaxID=1121868 RepID=A0A1T4VEL5_9GAMM|nr:DUF3319 domain-containing protein [Enterovibrio nigricans]PKF49365.1 DUF3319 domain-containing protein [Enterovibrio nigricans]SKA63419.1 Protein of unknown function [Enterovibrio nigricans DSM 22720]
MKKRYSHRGHQIESLGDHYTSIVNGKSVSGSLLGVKQCIDWWCDTRIFRRPSEFGRQDFRAARNARAENYKGFQIMSDEKQPGQWYILARGQLIKGSLPMIKNYIDSHSLVR